jgi:uncharacterized alkaline shock family protein YloU
METERTEEKFETKVKIANEVVGKIAAIAALEVEGVSAMGNNITSELMGKVGIRNLMKNVKVEIIEGKVKLMLSITVDYGVNIPVISSKVQAKVKSSVESMTNLHVSSVNVRIAGINQVN